MKLQKYYLLSIIVLLLNGVFFNTSTPSFIDTTPKTKIEVALEEEKSETKSDENLIVSISGLYLKETKVFTAYGFSIPTANQLYLNSIFKPPIFS